MALAEAEKSLSEAVSRFRAGDVDKAVALAQRAVALDPAYVEASLGLARLLATQKRAAEAEQVLRRAVAGSPQHASLMHGLGLLLCQTERVTEGVEWLERAVAREPASAVARFNLANGLRELGQVEAAAANYRAAIDRDPRNADAHHRLAECLTLLGQPYEAAASLDASARLRYDPAAKGQAPRYTTHSKLRHDTQQVEYLARLGALGAQHAGLVDLYRAALAALPPAETDTTIVEIPPQFREALAPTYNRMWHRPETPALRDGAINPDLDRAAIEADYVRRHPGITYFDNFLRPEALAAIRRFCLESTVWFEYEYANGYVGAFWQSGFWCPLLGQIAEDLRRAFPGIFQHHTLRHAWAFKYDNRLSGIPIHADHAAVNVNFWVTPDAASLDPDRNGLVVWDKEAPLDWEFAKYNANSQAIHAFLRANNAGSVRAPYRQNRAVMFNSDLFHETDGVAFADGYENRRVNITLLYGTRRG
jgi:Tfp pilus assembly protein PilF